MADQPLPIGRDALEMSGLRASLQRRTKGKRTAEVVRQPTADYLRQHDEPQMDATFHGHPVVSEHRGSLILADGTELRGVGFVIVDFSTYWLSGERRNTG